MKLLRYVAITVMLFSAIGCTRPDDGCMEDPYPVAVNIPSTNFSPDIASDAAEGSSTNHQVVVVGAGVAGLSSAYALDTMGYNVLVLEILFQLVYTVV